MIPDRLGMRWAEGVVAINAWLSIGDPFAAEIVAAQGYDSVTIDLQHGMIGDGAALAMLQALRGSGATPLVRVPRLDPAAVMRALDAGALGVICPTVNTRAQAEALASYVRYPPRGVRSYGPTRALVSAGADYGDWADDRILCLAMIETREALGNAAAIAATPGIDGVYVGPADLALDLVGRADPVSVDREEGDVVAAIRHVLAAAHAAGKRAGLHCGGPAYAARAAGWGLDLVTVSSEARLLAAAAVASLADTRASIAPAARGSGQEGRGNSTK